MSNKPVRRMPEITSQPTDVETYIRIRNQGNSVLLLVMLVARLIAVLANRKNGLTATEVQYIASGCWSPISYSDWTPEQEIEDGKDIPIIRPR